MKIDGNVIELRGAETTIDVDAPLRIKDGASFVDVRSYIAPDFRYQELIVKTVSTTAIDIDADFLYVGGKKFESINQTITVTDNDDWDSGNAGDEPADGWIHIWEMSNGTTLLPQFSLSSTAPTLRTGIISAKWIGSVRNTSGDFVTFYQQDDVVQKSVATLFTAITATDSGTSRDLSEYLPVNVKGVFCNLIIDNSVSATYFSGGGVLTGINALELSISLGGTFTAAYRFTTNGIVYVKSPAITTNIDMATGTFSMVCPSSGYIIKI